jgi:glycosyltransferase involved in cell wall biosynthesis
VTRVLILSELWPPQGGGAELATHLYASKMIQRGHAITVVSNREANLTDLPAKLQVLPFKASRHMKPSFLLSRRATRHKLESLAKSHDVAYITGLFHIFAPWLRKINPSLKILAHLHDYQLICPTASLVNRLTHSTCDYIWSDLDCARCTRRFLHDDREPFVASLSGTAVALMWKHAAGVENIIHSVDHFFLVSKGQLELMRRNLGRLGAEFERKTSVLYNPIDTERTRYVPPQLGPDVLLAFFGGNHLTKGFSELIDFFDGLDGDRYKLLATRVSPDLVGTHGRKEFRGNVGPEEMESLFQKIWIVLNTSIMKETFSYVVAESQLRGRPVIATAGGGVAENIVRQGFTGSVIEHGDRAAFKELVQQYVEKLRDGRASYAMDLSAAAKAFFDKRSQESYDLFLDSLN